MPVVADPPESHPRQSSQYLVDVAQLVEHRIVIPVVAGSIPVIHPTLPGLSGPPSTKRWKGITVRVFARGFERKNELCKPS